MCQQWRGGGGASPSHGLRGRRPDSRSAECSASSGLRGSTGTPRHPHPRLLRLGEKAAEAQEDSDSGGTVSQSACPARRRPAVLLDGVKPGRLPRTLGVLSQLPIVVTAAPDPMGCTLQLKADLFLED